MTVQRSCARNRRAQPTEPDIGIDCIVAVSE